MGCEWQLGVTFECSMITSLLDTKSLRGIRRRSRVGGVSVCFEGGRGVWVCVCVYVGLCVSCAVLNNAAMVCQKNGWKCRFVSFSASAFFWI